MTLNPDPLHVPEPEIRPAPVPRSRLTWLLLLVLGVAVVWMVTR